jgi:H+/gluconate symporter-like permease
VTSNQVVITLDLSTFLELLQALGAKARIESKLDQLSDAIGVLSMKSEEFQAKIDQINANTSASAAAATAAATAAGAANAASQVIKGQLDALREQIKGMGLSEAEEAALFANLDSAAQGTATVAAASASIKTANEGLAAFLEQTAAGPTEPAPVPVPEPAPEPTIQQ